ncbi:hypothetical protein JCM3263A_23320 [Thermobifida fusca]
MPQQSRWCRVRGFRDRAALGTGIPGVQRRRRAVRARRARPLPLFRQVFARAAYGIRHCPEPDQA